MSHPFEKFYRIWPAQELLDYAFSHASSQTASTPAIVSNLEKVKRKEAKRIEQAVSILEKKIRGFIESVPNLDELPVFYRRISHLLVNNDDLRLNLGRLNGIIPVLKKMEKEFTRNIYKADSAYACGNIRVEFFGRASSIVRKQDETLIMLEESRQKLMKIPSINLNMPAVVVAGYPNVGKSSIVSQISTVKPTISEYPFTTKEIIMGMYQDQTKFRFFQVIDTPGILDRPMAQRNEIEKQAILALNTIASVILFIFDPTPACGYELEHQINLYKEIQVEFLRGLTIPIKIVINKVDFASQEEIQKVLSSLQISKDEVILTDAKNGTNTQQIVDWLLQYFKEHHRNY
jgi:nucleolar GTP-binding protein